MKAWSGTKGGSVKRIVNLFRQHRPAIEMFLRNVVESEHFASDDDEVKIHASFTHLPFLQMVYHIGSDLKQESPNYYKKGKDESRIGTDKRHYFSNISLKESESYLTNPYIHHMTGHSSITMVVRRKERYTVFDFDLLKLLEVLKLIEHNTRFEHFNTFIYALGGFMLALISLFLIAYGGYTFISVFTEAPESILHDIFKAIIAVTLGLAIYDLAKTILENEVMYKDAGGAREGQYAILGKFLVSIIIALSIESLMVVFKITLADYTGLGYAFFLILGVSLMIIGLGWFDHLTKSKTARKKG
jgi:hypothetical protein